MNRSTRRYVGWVLGVAGLLMAAHGGLCVAGRILFPFDQRRFDAAVWQVHQQDTDPDNPRGPMVGDLSRRYLRRGQTRARVLALLGPPNDDATASEVNYTLGMWSGWRIDYDLLELTFDAHGRLVSWHHWQS